MKTAISIPDDTFKRASHRAQALGMSRSEFFSRAASHYLDELDAVSVTQQINVAVLDLEDQDDSTAAAVAIGRAVTESGSGDW